MIAILDAHYSEQLTRVACVLADSWRDDLAAGERVIELPPAAEYEPGQFYLRELPALTAVLELLPCAPDVIVVDAYAWLGEGHPGLGARLHEALGGTIPVIGVAKSAYAGAPHAEVIRGESSRPLYVTAAGMVADAAAAIITAMHGPNRLPDLIRRADQLARGIAVPLHG